jgi:hypothetical protein
MNTCSAGLQALHKHAHCSAVSLTAARLLTCTCPLGVQNEHMLCCCCLMLLCFCAGLGWMMTTAGEVR